MSERNAPQRRSGTGFGPRTRALHDGIVRIRLDSVCGLVVNAFVLRAEGHVLLVDTGFPYTADQLVAGLAELGLAPSDVTDVLITHLHIDHIGGALPLASRWSPRVWVWEGARAAFGDVNAHLESLERVPDWPAPLVDGHAGCPRRAERIAAMREKPLIPVRQADTPADGRIGDVRGVGHREVVHVGPWRFRCVDARGHGPTHVAWFEASRGWLFGGDAVLAVPTPLVAAMGDNARMWWRTLDRVATLDVRVLFPGHGGATTLWAPSIARSRASFARVYALARDALRGPAPPDPLDIALRVWPSDRSRFAARTAGALSTSALLLGASVEGGWTRALGTGRWESLAPLPESVTEWVRDVE